MNAKNAQFNSANVLKPLIQKNSQSSTHTMQPHLDARSVDNYDIYKATQSSVRKDSLDSLGHPSLLHANVKKVQLRSI